MVKLSMAKRKVPAYAKNASAGKLAPLLAARAIENQFGTGGSQRSIYPLKSAFQDVGGRFA
jgi:hypothetical protein